MRTNLGFILQALLAALFFLRESVSRRTLTAIFVITLASIFLSTDFQSGFGFSLGAPGVILACLLWSVDNNFTRNISAKDPLTTVHFRSNSDDRMSTITSTCRLYTNSDTSMMSSTRTTQLRPPTHAHILIHTPSTSTVTCPTPSPA